MFRTLLRESLCQTRRLVSWRQCLWRSTLSPPVSPYQWRLLTQRLGDYKKLAKAKLSTFVVFSAGTGFVLASPDEIEWSKLGATVVGTFGAAASANTLNQIYEKERDAMMLRTRLRPLPLGRLSIPHAMAFALASGCVGLTLLSHHTNTVATTLAASNILLYAGVYTPLKQVTHFNTWIGAIVGAIPPLIGWSAASGSLDPGAWLLFSALYFWQIPHFLALAWTYKADYIHAGFCMMSKVDPNGKRLAACAFRNCIYLLPLSFLSAYLGITTHWFSYESFLMTMGFALSASTFYQRPSKQHSRALFRSSIVYLPLYLLALLYHRLPASAHLTWAQLVDVLEQRWYRLRHSVTSHPDLEDDLSDQHLALFAPFPFVPLPIAATPSSFLWEGLDDVIQEFDQKSRTSLL